MGREGLDGPMVEHLPADGEVGDQVDARQRRARAWVRVSILHDSVSSLVQLG